MSRPIRRPRTPNDLEMTDPIASPVPSPRQPLPTSLASFALTHSSSAPSSPSSSYTMAIDREELGWPPAFGSASQFPTIRKLRRGSLLSLRSEDRPTVSLPSASSRSSSPRAGVARVESPVDSVFPAWKDDVDDSSAIEDSPVERRSQGESTSGTRSRSEVNLVKELSTRNARTPGDIYLEDLEPETFRAAPSSPPTRSDPPTSRSLDLQRSPGLDPPFNPSPPASKPIDVPQSATRVRIHSRPLKLIFSI